MQGFNKWKRKSNLKDIKKATSLKNKAELRANNLEAEKIQNSYKTSCSK